jgi:group I intron endonuclease
MPTSVHNIIYKTTNLANGKIYIGVHCTDDLNDGYIGCGIKRQSDVKLDTPFHNAVKKHGYDNFKRETMYEFGSAELAFWYESFLVDEDFIKREDTYNISLGGLGGNKGSIVNAKISKTLTGRKLTEECKKNMSIALKGRVSPMKGKKQSEKFMQMAKERCGEKHPMFGRTHSEETKKMWSEKRKGKEPWNKGKKMSKDFCDNMSRMQKGKKHSEETKQKMSISHQKRLNGGKNNA